MMRELHLTNFKRTLFALGTAAAIAITAAAAQTTQAAQAAQPSFAGGGEPAARTTGRDPFKLPPPPVSGAKPVAMSPVNLPPGVRGLIVSTLKLEGVVSEKSGRDMIAVVTNDTQRAYFLRVNERLYDGAVKQITPQLVIFTEWTRDGRGRKSVRTVVRRLNPKAGDGQ